MQELLELQIHEAPERQRWVRPPHPPRMGCSFFWYRPACTRACTRTGAYSLLVVKPAPKENVRARRDESHADDQRRRAETVREQLGFGPPVPLQLVNLGKKAQSHDEEEKEGLPCPCRVGSAPKDADREGGGSIEEKAGG